ncbi:MAG: nucleotide exchange factor GrpE [Defluviitaleaceae bacterium]|nr:nucleotide exchange factor GrpE [Defluviitaleaceae bacterium]
MKEDELQVEELETLETEELPEVLDAPKEENYLDKYQRCLAEFDNYRKRTVKEMAVRYDDGIRAACERLLPIADNFERALAAIENKEDSVYKGIEMLARQLDGALGEMGVTPIAIEIGGEFAPNLHYAVAHTEDENFGENQVAEVLQKGYTHREKVIRPVMVKVAN